jgi:hypothetical protein
MDGQAFVAGHDCCQAANPAYRPYTLVRKAQTALTSRGFILRSLGLRASTGRSLYSDYARGY